MISLSNIKTAAKVLFSIALDYADPYQATLNHFRRKGNTIYAGKCRYDLSRFNHIYVLGAGKAAYGMAKAAKKTIGNLITAGVIVIPYNYNHFPALNKIRVIRAGHPVPDVASVRAALKLKTLLESVTGNNLVIYLASGGGSALMTLPAPGITLKDLRHTTRLLLESGAAMPEINCIRKHLDLVKGGQLARLVYPASIITFVLSDITGDQLDMVGGGPTLPDPSTFKDACNILLKYKLWRKIPCSVRQRINSGLKGLAPETPKPKDHCFRKNLAVLIGTNKLAVKAAARKAKLLGLNTIIRHKPVIGEARLTAREHARLATRLASRTKKLLFIISGGETTVTVNGNGKGGRNQEYALAFTLEMEKLGFNKFICLSAGTDGRDYIKGVAGAMVDGTSLPKARRLGLNPEQLLRNHDSYRFHKPAGTLIKSGLTGANVNDLQIIAVW